MRLNSLPYAMCLVFALTFLIPQGTAVSQEAEEVTVTRWNNETFDGTFQGFSENGREILLESDGKTLRIPVKELLKLAFDGAGLAPELPTTLRLRGGGTLVGEIMEAGENGSVLLNTPLLTETKEVRLTWVEQVTFPDTDGSVSDSLETKKNDVLYETNGDRYRGFVTRITPKKVVFEDRNLGEKTFPLDRVLRMDLAPVGPVPSPPDSVYLEVHGAGGSVLTGTPVSATEKQLVLSSPLEEVTWTIDLENVRTILIKNGKTTFLSGKDPVEVEQKEVYPWRTDPAGAPDLPVRYQWRRDRAVPDEPGREEPLTLDGTVYEKGIGCTPYTKLTYKLNGKFSTFESTIGLDDLARHPEHEGTAVFRVYVEGEERYSSGPVGSSDSPKQIEVDVSGASRMSLEVDLGTGYLDFADWADARLIRNE